MFMGIVSRSPTQAHLMARQWRRWLLRAVARWRVSESVPQPEARSLASHPVDPWAAFTRHHRDIDWSSRTFASDVEVDPCGCACNRGAPCVGCGHSQCGAAVAMLLRTDRTHYVA